MGGGVVAVLGFTPPPSRRLLRHHTTTTTTTTAQQQLLSQPLPRERIRVGLLLLAAASAASSEQQEQQYDNNDNNNSKEQEHNPTSNHRSSSSSNIRVGICGAGSIALGMAAMLAQAGHDPMIWSPSCAGTASALRTTTTRTNKTMKKPVAAVTANDEEDSHGGGGGNGTWRGWLAATGAIATTPSTTTSSSTTTTTTTAEENKVVVPIRIAREISELMHENEVIVIALPANGHLSVMNAMIPFLDPNRHHVIISSHASFGALYLAQQYMQYHSYKYKYNSHLHAEDAPAAAAAAAAAVGTGPVLDLPITAWGTTVCTARRLVVDVNDDDDNVVVEPNDHEQKDDSTTTFDFLVKVNTIRTSVDMCTIPNNKNNNNHYSLQKEAVELCRTLFPRVSKFVVPQEQAGLLAVSLSNLNPQHHLGIALCNLSRMEKGEVWYQLYHITPKIGRLLEQLDAERLEICKALNIGTTKTIFDHFAQGFQVPIMDTISEMNQEIHRQGKDVHGPTTADSRYVTEDVPYGLALTIVLGDMVARPATLHRAGLQLLSALYGVPDFMLENQLLHALQLSRYSLDELKLACSTGVLSLLPPPNDDNNNEDKPPLSSMNDKLAAPTTTTSTTTTTTKAVTTTTPTSTSTPTTRMEKVHAKHVYDTATAQM